MKCNRGFIALISTIIISTILLVVVVAGSMTGFTTRFNMLDAESKQRSAALADACVDVLLFRLAQGTQANVPEVPPDADCHITNASSPYKIWATVSGAQTNLLVSLNAAQAISQIEEVAN